MPRIGVSITKSVAFRNGTQEFSNVYFYEVGITVDTTVAEAYIDNLTTLEKTFHGTNVTFVRGRVWSQIGTKEQNEMILQKNLSGTGARTAVTGMDKERAFLFRIRAGVDTRGNPVYLRKYFHACGQFVSAQAPSSAVLDNSTGFSTADRSAQVAAMNAVSSGGGSPGGPNLCAKSGRQPNIGATWEAHPFLEHHQLGDQWRAQ